jgi:outer membrane protein
MKKSISNLSIVSLILLAVFSSASTEAKDLKIGVVDVQAVAQKLPQMADIQYKVREEFKEQVGAITKLQSDAKYNYDKLQREGATMSVSQTDELKKTILAQQQELESKAKPLQQQMKRRGAEEQNKVLALVDAAIKVEAKNNGYNIILHKESVAYSDSPLNDISDKVVERVKK